MKGIEVSRFYDLHLSEPGFYHVSEHKDWLSDQPQLEEQKKVHLKVTYTHDPYDNECHYSHTGETKIVDIEADEVLLPKKTKTVVRTFYSEPTFWPTIGKEIGKKLYYYTREGATFHWMNQD